MKGFSIVSWNFSRSAYWNGAADSYVLKSIKKGEHSISPLVLRILSVPVRNTEDQAPYKKFPVRETWGSLG